MRDKTLIIVILLFIIGLVLCGHYDDEAMQISLGALK